MVDSTLQRKNMVESQVRPSDITNRRLITALLAVPREAFVPRHMQSVAYMDEELEVALASKSGGEPRALLAPRTLAKLLQAAKLEAGDIVLDIGCATGYSSAIIANMVETVVALECDEALAELAGKTLSDLSLNNAAVVTGDLAKGYASEGPYDAIIVGGMVDAISDDLLDQLKDGGHLVAIVRSSANMAHAVVWGRLGDTYDRREVTEVSGPMLPGFAKTAAFAL